MSEANQTANSDLETVNRKFDSKCHITDSSSEKELKVNMRNPNMLFLILSTCLTGYMFYICQIGSSLFSWHPACMTTAYLLLMVQGILSLSPESVVTKKMSRPAKIDFHWILQVTSLLLIMCGGGAIYVNKINLNKEHFTSWHGILGLSSNCLVICVSLGGACAKYSQSFKKLIKPFQLKTMHALFAVLTFLLAYVTFVLGMCSKWAQGNFPEAIRVFYIIGIVAVGLYTIQHPIRSLLSRFKKT